MITRAEQRILSAQYLNSISREDLFSRFEITRIANITGYDIIGVPVYSSVRPAGKSISTNGGKGWTKEFARAGAVAEAIEFNAFENLRGDFHLGPFGDKLQLPTCKDSEWKPDLPIAIEQITHFASGRQVEFPSDLIWLIRRVKAPKYFMHSSNGQALGSTFSDAFLTGLYELVERDQQTLRRISWMKLDVAPPRVEIPLRVSVPAGLELYLFYCSLDIHIPVFWAILAGDDGTVGGSGAHLQAEVAAERAILEAIQSRAILFSGARDDIQRRDFQEMKGHALKRVRQELGSLPMAPFPHSCMPELEVEDELSIVLHKLSAWREHIYFKHLDLGDFQAVKTVILGLESPRFPGEPRWKQTRYFTLAQAYINASQDRSLENSGVVQRLKEISLEMSSSYTRDKSA